MWLVVFDPLQLNQKLNSCFWIWYKHSPALTTQAAALTFWLDPYLLILLPRHTLCLSLSSIHCSSLYGCVPCGEIIINLTDQNCILWSIFKQMCAELMQLRENAQKSPFAYKSMCWEKWTLIQKRWKGNRTVFPEHVFICSGPPQKLLPTINGFFYFWHYHAHIRHIQLLNLFIICHNQYFCAVLECTTNVRWHTHATLLWSQSTT